MALAVLRTFTSLNSFSRLIFESNSKSTHLAPMRDSKSLALAPDAGTISGSGTFCIAILLVLQLPWCASVTGRVFFQLIRIRCAKRRSISEGRYSPIIGSPTPPSHSGINHGSLIFVSRLRCLSMKTLKIFSFNSPGLILMSSRARTPMLLCGSSWSSRPSFPPLRLRPYISPKFT